MHMTSSDGWGVGSWGHGENKHKGKNTNGRKKDKKDMYIYTKTKTKKNNKMTGKGSIYRPSGNGGAGIDKLFPVVYGYIL